MSEMVDKVAWAMREVSEFTFDDCVPLARAAIEAMREPTDKMATVGFNIETDRYARYYPQEDKCADECWRAMIDEVLR